MKSSTDVAYSIVSLPTYSESDTSVPSSETNARIPCLIIPMTVENLGDFYKLLEKVFNIIVKIYLNVEFIEVPLISEENRNEFVRTGKYDGIVI